MQGKTGKQGQNPVFGAAKVPKNFPEKEKKKAAQGRRRIREKNQGDQAMRTSQPSGASMRPIWMPVKVS